MLKKLGIVLCQFKNKGIIKIQINLLLNFMIKINIIAIIIHNKYSLLSKQLVLHKTLWMMFRTEYKHRQIYSNLKQ